MKAVVTAHNHLPHSQAVLFEITNHDESRTALDSVIETLTICERNIAEAMATAKEPVFTCTNFAAIGYHGWICNVCRALNYMKDNFETNPVDIRHLVKFNPLDPEYKQVWCLITGNKGIAKGGVSLIIWILRDNPTDAMLSAYRTQSGVYVPRGYSLFKKKNGTRK